MKFPPAGLLSRKSEALQCGKSREQFEVLITSHFSGSLRGGKVYKWIRKICIHRILKEEKKSYVESPSTDVKKFSSLSPFGDSLRFQFCRCLKVFSLLFHLSPRSAFCLWGLSLSQHKPSCYMSSWFVAGALPLRWGVAAAACCECSRCPVTHHHHLNGKYL